MILRDGLLLGLKWNSKGLNSTTSDLCLLENVIDNLGFVLPEPDALTPSGVYLGCFSVFYISTLMLVLALD